VFSNVLGDSETASQLFGANNGFIFAFQAMPIVIFMSALTAVLYHLGIMQVFVAGMARIMRCVMRISGAEASCSAVNVFLGPIESPLAVRPYLGAMTVSELHCVMVAGLATVSGSVLGGYVALLNGRIDNIAAHFIAASIMSAPAAVVFAKLLVPETDTPETMGKFKSSDTKIDPDVISACTRGCSEGVQVAINVMAMLIGFMAIILLIQEIWNTAVFACGGNEHFMMQSILGYVFSPFAFLLGIPVEDIVHSGRLLGEKTLINEFVAYSHLADLLNSGGWNCSERTRIILSYALCGFANFGSIGIILGGIGSLIPERKALLASLALRAILGGTFASFSTAVIVGILI